MRVSSRPQKRNCGMVQILDGMAPAGKRAVLAFATGAGRPPPRETEVLRVGLASSPAEHSHPDGILGRLPQVRIAACFSRAWAALHQCHELPLILRGLDARQRFMSGRLTSVVGQSHGIYLNELHLHGSSICGHARD